MNLEVNGYKTARANGRNGSMAMPDEVTSDMKPETWLWWTASRPTCVVIYTVITLSMVVVVFVRCVMFVSFFMNSSMNLHNNMFNAIIRATMHFFNTNSSGNKSIFF